MNDFYYHETVIEHYAGQNYFGVSTGERGWKAKLSRLAERHPDACVMITQNDDGSVYYHVPESWVTIRPPKKMNLTEEQKAERAERLRMARNYNSDERETD